jgi:hypothetical protein
MESIFFSENTTNSAWPDGLGVNAYAVMRTAFDDAVGSILNAEEVERRIGVVSPTTRRRRTHAQHRTFRYVDALAVHQKLPVAAKDDINLIISSPRNRGRIPGPTVSFHSKLTDTSEKPPGH